MAQPDLFKRYLDVGMAVTELTRTRAEKVVKDLVRAGEVQRDRAQEAVDELLDRSRRNTQAIAKVVREELRTQMTRLGLVTNTDLARLERKLDAPSSRSGAKRAGSAKKSPAKTSTAKKSPAKTSTAKKSSAKRSTAKKTAAKKSPAKTSTAKKAAAKKG